MPQSVGITKSSPAFPLFSFLFFCFKQSGISLGHIYTLCSSSAWTLGSQTHKEPSIHHAHICACPVCNTKAICWGSHSPSLPSNTACSDYEWTTTRGTCLISLVFFQKRLTIQGKSVDMHYSNSRNKYEDWLCNTVSDFSFSRPWPPYWNSATSHNSSHSSKCIGIWHATIAVLFPNFLATLKFVVVTVRLCLR